MINRTRIVVLGSLLMALVFASTGRADPVAYLSQFVQVVQTGAGQLGTARAAFQNHNPGVFFPAMAATGQTLQRAGAMAPTAHAIVTSPNPIPDPLRSATAQNLQFLPELTNVYAQLIRIASSCR